MSEIEGLKHDIKSMKGTMTDQLQYDMDKRGFSYRENNTNTIIDTMESKTKQIMKEMVRKTEVLTSKLTEESGTNDSNRMDIVIEEEEEGEGNKCFDKCFDDKNKCFTLKLSVSSDDLLSADSELVTRKYILECTSYLDFEF